MSTFDKIADHAHVATFGGSATTVVIAGFNLNQFALFVSIVCTICGVLIQYYVARAKIRAMERRQDVADLAVSAVAASNRAVAKKAEVAGIKADVAIDLAKATVGT